MAGASVNGDSTLDNPSLALNHFLSMSGVLIQNVGKVFRGPGGEAIRAVRNVSLQLRPGEWLTLVGPSGSGKTTLLRLIAGLEEPTEGQVRYSSHDRPEIAMVFQQDALFPHLSAFDNIALSLRLRKIAKSELEPRVREIAGLLGILECLTRKPQALSGGQRQRVSLARALVRRPEILLLDEPLASIDAPLRAQLRTEILRLHAQFRPATIYVTHDQFDAMSMGGWVAVMHMGEVRQLATPQRLYEEPADLFVATFIGSPPMNMLPGKLHHEHGKVWFLSSIHGGGPGWRFEIQEKLCASLVQIAAGTELVLGVRPEHLWVGSAPADQCPQGWILGTGTLQACEFTGPESYLSVSCGTAILRARVADCGPVKIGAQVQFAFDPHRANYFDGATGRRYPH